MVLNNLAGTAALAAPAPGHATEPAALGRFLIKLYRDSKHAWRSPKTGALITALPFVIFVSFPHAPTGRRWLTVHGLPVLDDAKDANAAVRFFELFDTAAREAAAEYIMDSFDSATMLLDVEHKGALARARGGGGGAAAAVVSSSQRARPPAPPFPR